MRRPLSPSAFGARARVAGLQAAVLIFTILYLPVRPARADIAIGASAGSFLDFEIGAGPAGLAGANTSVASGATAQFWNPALLADLNRPQASLMHATWLGDLNYEWLGYARPLSPGLGVGSVSIAYFHMPSISGVDQFDNPTGEFRAYDMAMTFGLARPMGRGMSVGANVKAIRQTLADVSATGAAVDLGVGARFHGTSFGATVQNLGPSLSFGGAAYPLPQQVRFGMGHNFLSDRLLVAADFNIPKSYYRDVRVGTEYKLHSAIAVRLGYRQELGAGADPATGLSFGLGAHAGPLDVDYAMTPDNEFSDVHRLSLGYTFGGAEAKPEPKAPEPKKPAAPQQPEPKGPPVIVTAPTPRAAPKAPAPKPEPAVTASAAPQTTSSVAPQTTRGAAPQAAAPSPAPPIAAKPAPKAAGKEVYEVVLGSYQSEDAAASELKALQILGFNVKDAKVTYGPGEGYRISLARLGSRKSADELAASLVKLSFQPRVELAHR